MRSSYKPLGENIREVNIRNADLHISTLLGININKYYMPSVANIVGTDLSVYKIVKPGQFACNRMHVGRDYRLPVALSNRNEEFIVSPAYDVFEIIDNNKLLPEYLMMWFSRKEFDRNAWFYTDADVRGGLPWSSFCEMELPIPHPDKQRELIKEYNTIVNRIELNNQIIKKLEDTAHALYKQWFVDFEFPDENGKPYKSNGGEMEFNKDLDKEIPKNWKNGTLNNIVDIIDGDRGENYPSIEEMSDNGYCLFLNAGNVSKNGFKYENNVFISKNKDEKLRKGKLKRSDLVLTTRGTVGNVGYYSDAVIFSNIRINSGMVILRGKKSTEPTIFIYSMLRNKDVTIAIENYMSGSAQPQLPIKDLIQIPVIIPEESTLKEFSRIALKFQNLIDLKVLHNLKLNELKNILLSKLATIED